jgi:hypothetical protein
MKPLEGYETKAEHAAALGVCEKTIDRWCAEPDGLPFTSAGRWRLFRREWTAEWLGSRKQQKNARAQRGRGRQP